MIVLIAIAWAVFSKLVLIAIFLTANRLLSKLEIGKLGFMLSVFFADSALMLLIFAWSVNFLLILVAQSLPHYFLFQWFKNYNLIGLTGTIGSGKSTLVSLVRVRNKEIAIIDCDKISRKLYTKHKGFISRAKSIFTGYKILSEDGQIDRKRVSEIIFDPKNAALKNRFLRWIFMYIFWRIFVKIYRIFFVKKYVLAIVDAPTLFESKVLKFVTFPIVTVYLDNEDELIRRVKLRDTEATEDEIRAKLRNQMPTKRKIELSDVIICNNSSTEHLYTSFMTEIFGF
jgi:dephospho-CoA kinase